MCALDLSSEPAYISHVLSEDDTQAVVQPSPDLSLITRYDILHRQSSESAWIFFTWDSKNAKALVMKMLRPYSDTRYSLSTVTERQQCQLEAFQQNRNFTPEVYIGIARLYNQPSKEDHILIGGIIQRPVDVKFEPDAEYALIMERLPDERRLDQLLKCNKDNEDDVFELLSILTSSIASLHTHRTLSLSKEESAKWGGFANLQRKLEENLAFLALVPTRENDPAIEVNVKHIIQGLRQVFTQERYGNYLEQRIYAGYIKHCHGDIKALNIWIMPGKASDQLQHLPVKLLDAIDFNPLFRNIDILSDFAMLVVDVQARTSSSVFARSMIDDYLRLTSQDEKSARSLLDFYVVEKAIVAATINFLFDNQYELGKRLLLLARVHLDHLMRYWNYQLAQ